MDLARLKRRALVWRTYITHMATFQSVQAVSIKPILNYATSLEIFSRLLLLR